jgi:hypothetical protein
MKKKLLTTSAVVAFIAFAPGLVYAYALALGSAASSSQTEAVAALAFIGGCVAGLLAIASIEAKS